MGLAYIEGAGGGGVRSSDVTATAADILSGKTDLTSTSDDEVVQGTMPNNGTVNQTLGINGSYTIPAGYHSGSGKVSQSVSTKAAATYYATTSDQTIAANQWLSGAQTIKKLTQTNLSGGNIKPGVVVKVNNGNTDVFSVTGSMASKGAGTYYATTADQTIAANQYLTGVQTIKKLTQTNLSAGNIRNGTTVTVHNGNANVFSVAGTLESPIKNFSAFAFKGFNVESANWQTSEEETYTMPRKGHIYFGMVAMAYGSGATAVCEILVNNVVKERCDISNWDYSWRKYAPGNFAVNANDVVKIRASVSGGSHVMSFVDIHIAC